VATCSAVSPSGSYGNPSEQPRCGKPAVIRYDGRNLCADCADRRVLALYVNTKMLAMNGWNGPDLEWSALSEAIAALTPPEDS
jgi:hypothetical protein